MGEDFGWSHSSLQLINQCGYRWKLQYQTDVQPDAGSDLPQFAFGRAVHKLIEEIHLQAFWDLQHWVPYWDEVWADLGSDVDWDRFPGRKNQYDRLGRQILAAYTEEESNRLAQIEGLEQRFDVEIEGLRVKGVIDQIRRTPDGLLLIDFKTSKEPSHPLVERTDAQLTLYAYVCKLLTDEMPLVAHYYLRTGQLVATERREEDIEPLLGMMREAEERVAGGMLTRQLGWHCGECSYRTTCLGALAG